MATTSPTPNYGWVLPVPGGSIGAWGTILNKIFGSDGAGDDALGIDGVLFALQEDISGTDGLEDQVEDLDSRVDTLEASGATALYARLYRSSNQTIPSQSPTQVTFNAESFDQGGLSSGGPAITVPASGAGVWQVRTQIEIPYHVSGDDGRLVRLELYKDSTKVAEARHHSLNDGVSSGSGNLTLACSYLDATAVEGTAYTVKVYHHSGTAAVQGGEDSTFLEAVRLIAS